MQWMKRGDQRLRRRAPTTGQYMVQSTYPTCVPNLVHECPGQVWYACCCSQTGRTEVPNSRRSAREGKRRNLTAHVAFLKQGGPVRERCGQPEVAVFLQFCPLIPRASFCAAASLRDGPLLPSAGTGRSPLSPVQFKKVTVAYGLVRMMSSGSWLALSCGDLACSPQPG